MLRRKKVCCLMLLLFAVLIVVKGDEVFIDSSANQCSGCVNNETLYMKWSSAQERGVNTSLFSCLKDCVQLRAKMAVFHRGELCLCMNNSFLGVDSLSNNKTCCYSRGDWNKHTASVYNLTGVIIQFAFREYIKQNTVAEVRYLALLCDEGKAVNGRNTLLRNSSAQYVDCTLQLYQNSVAYGRLMEKKILDSPCSANIVFSHVGETTVCIGNYSATGSQACNIVKVLSDLEITVVALNGGHNFAHYPLQTSWSVEVKGSVFELSYEFGDGSREHKTLIQPYVYEVCAISLTIAHKYALPGTYNFTITASNPLYRCSEQMFIKYQLDVSLIFDLQTWTKHRTVFQVKALHHIVGTRLTYKWSNNYPLRGVTINRTETSEPFTELIVWKNSTTLNRIMFTVVVFAPGGLEIGRKAVRSVRLNKKLLHPAPKIQCEQTYVESGKEIVCRLLPPSGGTVNWTVNGRRLLESNSTLRFVFNETGRYNISVDHLNVSFFVKIQDTISELAIIVPPTITAGLSTIFEVTTKPAEDVNYTWYLGDGSSRDSGKKNVIEYSYKKPGTYELKVVATNHISTLTKTTKITVTSFCFDLESSFKNGSEVDLLRSRPLHLEFGITYSKCVQPVKVTLIWKMFEEDGAAGWKNVALEKQNINKTTFGIHISPNILQYKKYKFVVSASVVLHRTFKYPKEYTAVINVISTPLTAVIRGGLVRYVSQTSKTITMDGSISADPDYPTNRNMRFLWTCVSKALNSSCFRAGDPLKNTGVMVDIATSQFREKGFPFLFELVVSSGVRDSMRTFQLVFIESGMDKNVILDCLSCNDGILNPSKPIVLIQKCLNCKHDKEASWSVKQFGDEFLISSLYFKEIPCVNPDQELVGHGRAENNNSITNFTNELCEKDSFSAAHSRQVNSIICSESSFHDSLCRGFGVQRSISANDLQSGVDKTVLAIKPNILPHDKFLLIESITGKGHASRYVYVEDLPPVHSCSVGPTTGTELQETFRLTCFSFNHKSPFLVYKVVFERQNDDGTRMPDIVFQGPLTSMAFQLPSGTSKTVKYSLRLWVENDKGVEQEYCPMNIVVSRLNPGPNITIEEYLYNRSLQTMDMLHCHQFAYHGTTLHNVTILADVLNRQAKARRMSSKFHLRTEIRMNLLKILSQVEITSEHIMRQFSASLESCTRVPEELNHYSTSTAVTILNKMADFKSPLSQGRTVVSERIRNMFVAVSSRLLDKIAEQGDAYHNNILVNALESSFKTIVTGTRMDEPAIHITEPLFNATLLKLPPYLDELSVNVGNTNLSLHGLLEDSSVKSYYSDVFGTSVVAMALNVVDQDGKKERSPIVRVTPGLKLKKYNFEGKNDYFIVASVGATLPRLKKPKTSAVPKQHVNYTINPRKYHQLILSKNNNSALEIELISATPLSSKFNLKMLVRCADQYKRSDIILSVLAQSYPAKRIFSRERLAKCYQNISVFIEMQWITPPNRNELRTEVNYTIVARWVSCLSKERDKSRWYENSCRLEGDPSYFVKCSCNKAFRHLIGASRQTPFLFEVKPIASEGNAVMWVVIALSLIFVVTVVLLVLMEKRELARRRSCFVLAPSSPTHNHKYQVTVFTGHVYGAGTTAKVALVLYGEQNSSFPVELFVENQSLFTRSSREIFVISARQHLGPLTKIHLWHDNSGHSPSWFVEKVIIKDLVTEEKWMFKCCRWLAVDKQDKKLDCKVLPYDGEHELTFKEFRFLFGKKLLDIHLWLSCVTVPSYSLFRRSERLLTCVLIVFSYFCVNAYFCNSGGLMNLDCIFLFNPTWRYFEIGILSALVVFPLHLLVTSLFRFTKPSEKNDTSRMNFPSRNEVQRDGKKRAVSAPLDKCASVMQELHYRSQRYMMRNRVDSFPHSDELDLVRHENQMDKAISDRISLAGTSYDNNSLASTTIDSVYQYPFGRNIPDHEITSQGSGSYMALQHSEKTRLPTYFAIVIRFVVVILSIKAAYLTVHYTEGFDILAILCFWQCVLWSFIISFCIFQPLQALLCTIVIMLHRTFAFYSGSLEDQQMDKEAAGGNALIITDSSSYDNTEPHIDDTATSHQKYLYLKYLEPVPVKELAKMRSKLKKKSGILAYIRSLTLYTFLLVLLYLMTLTAEHESVLLHNRALEDVFTRQANLSSLTLWWSTSPQKLLDTIKFDKSHGTISALQGKAVVIGSPKIRKKTKYCQIGGRGTLHSSRNCSMLETIVVFRGSLQDKWLALKDIPQTLTQHVKELSLQFVLYTPATLNAFSVVKLSCKVLLASSLQHDVDVKTARFFVDGFHGNIKHIVLQVLFTVVLALLIAQYFFETRRWKIQVDLQLLILILSSLSFIIMWLWNANQYTALTMLRDKSFESDLSENTRTTQAYEECFWLFVALLQFFVTLKVFDMIGFGKLLLFYSRTFYKTLTLVVAPLFCLVVILVSFAHMGLLLFGDHLANFGNFVESLGYTVVYLREGGPNNLVLENRDQQTILSLYVVSFCICVGLVSYLVKASFIQAYSRCLRTMKGKGMSLKAILRAPLRRVRFLIAQYRVTPNKNEQPYTIPLRYILKEVNEQLDEIEFRMVNLFATENMPPKRTRISSSSSSEYISELEYVYRGTDEVKHYHANNDPLANRSVSTSTTTSPSLESNTEEPTRFDYASITSHTPSTTSADKLNGHIGSDGKAESVSSTRSGVFTRDFPKPIIDNASYNPVVQRIQVRAAAADSNDGNLAFSSTNGRKRDTKAGHPVFTTEHRFRRPAFPVPIDVLFNQSTEITNNNIPFCGKSDSDEMN